MPPATAPPIKLLDVAEDDDDEGWQEMPVVREDRSTIDLDEEDQKKYHYKPSSKFDSESNATGNLLDYDEMGNEWRAKGDMNENDYTRLRVNEEDETDEVHLRTKYLFDEDKAMTPLSQMQATKNLLTEAQRIAYVGLCALTSREMAQKLKLAKRKELQASSANLELWSLKIMGRLYYHMELETQEQKMIESLGEHGVEAMDLVPALMTTHTVANPEYDPVAAEALREEEAAKLKTFEPSHAPTPSQASFQTTARVLEDTATSTIAGVTTSLSVADEKVTLDIRWTVLCDLFLILIADSVYDARSRVLLEMVALKLGLGWLDVVKFESRVTEALEIQEDVESMEHGDIIEGRVKSNKKKRIMMLGLATIGGGLVIGLSAGLLAPVIGGGIGVALGTLGITGTGTFLAGAGGAAIITTGGVLTGSGIAARGMAKRTQQVKTFNLLPLHNNKRVNCIITVPGFLNGLLDDPRLPFSVLDPIVGDVFSALWEPEMIQETGSALKILTGEVLTQIGQTVLQATVMATLMSALQWPIVLTKLGYLIDNPWNNALDRARAAGSVLADVLIQRHLGVRPITLIGFSLGARVIFYALLELAKKKAFGIVQDVFLLGTTLSASVKSWCETRSVVSGRYVNAYARNDWLLNYLFRATSGGVGTVAGLRPVENVPGLENVDVTDKISGHMSYRTFMPLILDQLGFPVSADYFDEPEQPDFEGERVVVNENEAPKKKSWFRRDSSAPSTPPKNTSRPPGSSSHSSNTRKSTDTVTSKVSEEDNDLPPRVQTTTPADPTSPSKAEDAIPVHAGFDLGAIKQVIDSTSDKSNPAAAAAVEQPRLDTLPPPTLRSESMPRHSSHSHPPVPGPSAVRAASYEHSPSSDASASSAPTTPKPPRPEDLHQSFTFMSLDEPPHRTTSPTLSFGSTDGSYWQQPTSTFRTPSSHNPFSNNPYNANPFGASSTSISQNPFQDPSASVLSFGSSDGSIMLSPPPVERTVDPWAVPSLGKKESRSSFNSNPWS